MVALNIPINEGGINLSHIQNLATSQSYQLMLWRVRQPKNDLCMGIKWLQLKDKEYVYIVNVFELDKSN